MNRRAARTLLPSPTNPVHGRTTRFRRGAAGCCLFLVSLALGALPALPICSESATELCLNGDRYRVEVRWKDFAGNTGFGQVVPVSSTDSGLFWFFGADNWEVLVKVLDACGVNGHVWVFSAATTTVEYSLQVTDTVTGSTRTYFNPLGNAAAAITDTSAFAACGGAGALSPRTDATIRLDGPLPTGVSVDRSPQAVRTKDCESQPIACDSTVEGELDLTDCPYLFNGEPDGTFFDAYSFDAEAGQKLEIELQSLQFEPYLELLDPSGTKVAEDDGDLPTGSRIEHTADSTGEWTIIANNFPAVPGSPGPYHLSLSCFLSTSEPAAAPSNLVATAISATEIHLSWIDNSDNEFGFEVQARPAGGSFQRIGGVGTDVQSLVVDAMDGLEPGVTYTFRVRALSLDGDSDFSNLAVATTGSDPSPCLESATTLCLSNGRFQVQVQWQDFLGNTGLGQRVPFGSNDSGLLWFFDANNWEMLIKVIDACDFGGHFWVFGAATTNVDYVLEVVDTVTGATKSYTNPLGNAAPAITDTSAFATCP